jgi:outer membrane receptor protein involved in Fe transport
LYTQTTRNINNIYRATVKKNFGDFSNTLTAGFAFEDNNTKLESQKGERFYERDFYSINNTDPLSRDARTTLSTVRKQRGFANLLTGYKNILFLSLAGTREGVSTFMSRVVDKNPFFNYGSVSMSFIMSDLAPLKKLSWMNYAKLRASYASTGKGPYAPYVIDYRFTPQITTGGGYAYDVTGNNFGLEPEFSKNFEYGGEFRFLNSRITLDVARYSLRSQKQLLAARASYGTGFVIKWFNGGLVENKGIELQLGITPVRNNHFNWTSLFNYDNNVGTVLEMPAGLPTYYDSDTWVFGNLRSQYFKGAKIGNMASNTLRRNSAGQVLISPTTGLPIRDDEFRTVGDRQPDFKLGWVNNLRYDNFDLSFNLDFRKGGDVFNGTEYFLYLTGYSKKNLNRETPVVVEGVLQDGLENTANPTKNTIAVTPLYNSAFYGTGAATEEDFIESVDWIRLRDITLSYTFSPNLLKRQKAIKSASVFVTGTDVFMITNYSGADPSVNANNASSRGFGGAGIDFGSISMPRGINFGLRVNL